MSNASDFIISAVETLRTKIGTAKALSACSGGVDSTVASVLAQKALGDRVIAVYVDSGLMRKNETVYVEEIFRKTGLNYKIIHAEKRFVEALKGVTNPEEKRKIVGELFIRIFEETATEFGAEYLIQGTIAPDWIESGGGLRDRIKSHHNVAGLPEQISLKIVEPLRDLYKDEVREIARTLNISVSERQPFPGPGLAVRIIGEVTEEKLHIIRECCAIVEEELDLAVKNNKIAQPWQYFAVLLPVKSVGVHGDVRAYGETVAIRSVESVDAMSAEYSKIPHDVLEKISIRITNTLKDKVNRVVYDITHKPPATIEWE